MLEILDAYSALPEAHFAPDDCLIQEGSPGGKLYVLISGEVVVLKGETEVARVSEPGSIFGEMSALLDLPYSATVRGGRAGLRPSVGKRGGVHRREPGRCPQALPGIPAQRLHAATAYLADVESQFADQKNHFAMMDRILDTLMQRQASRAPRPRTRSDRDCEPVRQIADRFRRGFRFAQVNPPALKR